MLRSAVVLTALIFSVDSFAEKNAPTVSLAPKTTEGNLTVNADKAKDYDTWTEKKKVAVSQAMGLDLATLPVADRAHAISTLTEQDKADAYDFYSDHKKALKKAI